MQRFAWHYKQIQGWGAGGAFHDSKAHRLTKVTPNSMKSLVFPIRQPLTAFGEIKKGLAKMPDSRRKQDLIIWLQTMLADYSARILPVDLAVAENWGILQGRAEIAGTPMATLDGLIAATAHTHNLTVVTRNERDFAPAHIPLCNPWTA